MKKTVFAALAVATAFTAAAGAANAQPYGGRYDDYDRGDRYEGRYEGRWERNHINQRQQQIERLIDVGQRRGDLTRNEAARLRDQTRDVARLEARYRYDGLSGWERADLDRRLDGLEARLQRDLNDRQYGYGYGYRR